MGLKAACIGAAQRLEFPKKLGICERLFGAALARRGVAWVPVRTGLRWKLDLRNPTHRWIVYGYYDPAFLKWAERRLTPASVVVDSGANIGQTVLYLTERASFRLTNAGVELFEIAPGCDLQRDVLDQMDFLPRVAADLRVMDSACFRAGT